MTYAEQLEWLLEMARNPGAKDHAWRRAKELAGCQTGMWTDMHLRLAEAMQHEASSESGREPG